MAILTKILHSFKSLIIDAKISLEADKEKVCVHGLSIFLSKWIGQFTVRNCAKLIKNI